MNSIAKHLKYVKPYRAHNAFAYALLTADRDKLLRDILFITTSMDNVNRIDMSAYVWPDNRYKMTMHMIVWPPGDMRTWHGHPGKLGSMGVIKGRLVELVRHKNSQALTRNICKPGTTTRITDNIGKHAVYNIETSPTYSLHLTTPVLVC